VTRDCRTDLNGTVPGSTIWPGSHTVIRSDKLKPYLSKARSIPLSIHPFANIQRAFYAGVPEAAEEEEDDE
jgi:hypothetical protein